MAFDHITTLKDEQLPLLSISMRDAIHDQTIFWSDDRECHWFFDFKHEGLWVSSWLISNDLRSCVVDIYDPEAKDER